MYRLLIIIALLYAGFATSAVPVLPLPTGSCSGIIPLEDQPQQTLKDSRTYDGSFNLSIVLDFDEAKAYGTFLFFDDWDGNNETFAQWSIDQDASGTSFSIERDELLPAAFLLTLSLDLPIDENTPDLVGVQPTGNVFQEYTVRLRLLPIAGGSTYVIQGINATIQGFCAAL